MARRKRQPYDPAKIHDRRATEINIGTKGHIVYMEVDDPFEPGAKIIASRSTRKDPLAEAHSKGSIDEAMYQGARDYQDDFATIERGPRAVDPSNPYVDCSLPPQGMSDNYSKALARLNLADRKLGEDGCSIVRGVLIECWTYRKIAASRGFEGRIWEEYFSKRFKECLTSIAFVYGYIRQDSDKRRIVHNYAD